MYKFYNNNAKHPHLLSVNCLSRKKRQFFFSEKNNLISITRLSRKKKHRKRERRINLVGEDGMYLFRDGREEHSFFFVFFVGGDREVRRYLFHSCASEIEFE